MGVRKQLVVRKLLLSRMRSLVTELTLWVLISSPVRTRVLAEIRATGLGCLVLMDRWAVLLLTTWVMGSRWLRFRLLIRLSKRIVVVLGRRRAEVYNKV